MVLVGGGSPKNFTLQTEPQIQEVLRITEAGHDYFLQFTDARPDTGGLSGATPHEAVSWGKVDPTKLPDAIVCYIDSTVALPLLAHYALARHKPRKLKRLYERLPALMAQEAREYWKRNKKLRGAPHRLQPKQHEAAGARQEARDAALHRRPRRAPAELRRVPPLAAAGAGLLRGQGQPRAGHRPDLLPGRRELRRGVVAEFMLVHENIKQLPPGRSRTSSGTRSSTPIPPSPGKPSQALDQYKPLVTYDNLERDEKNPAIRPPRRRGAALARAQHRLAMVELSSKFGARPAKRWT